MTKQWRFRTWVFASLILFCCRHSSGFDSYAITSRSVHDKITAEASQRLTIDTSHKLQEAVRAPDWEETTLSGLRLRPNAQYDASHHFDRGPNQTHVQAFATAANYVRTEREKCIVFAKSGKHDAALASLGRVLHAVQDLVSHSNLIDLTEQDRAAVVDSLWSGLNPPSPIKLTGYDPHAAEPGEPTGDDFSHDSFSKDNANKNDECRLLIGNKSKFSVAYDLAVDLSTDILQNLKSELTPEQWNRLSALLK